MIGWLRGWRHARLRRLLSTYVDGSASESERARVEAHLSGCECMPGGSGVPQGHDRPAGGAAQGRAFPLVRTRARALARTKGQPAGVDGPRGRSGRGRAPRHARRRQCGGHHWRWGWARLYGLDGRGDQGGGGGGCRGEGGHQGGACREGRGGRERGRKGSRGGEGGRGRGAGRGGEGSGGTRRDRYRGGGERGGQGGDRRGRGGERGAGRGRCRACRASEAMAKSDEAHAGIGGCTRGYDGPCCDVCS